MQHTLIGIQAVHFDVSHHGVPEQGIVEAADRIKTRCWRPAVALEKGKTIT